MREIFDMEYFLKVEFKEILSKSSEQKKHPIAEMLFLPYK
jgi:hypothetical protein